ncbi:uncharacterized protein CDV56_102650 [Aspergillus thermomutatus]|uniref:DUF7730 domain-containing protein n=1 Tax=Aspergillus thermomutatus TaxID=41047 RepID=A0A397GKB2_ASPTH|nr:uncharacterized protein CDV56_102650 [Aspergillus thermomutatus]RHZ48500.1 hypothetical protein CDV56_102650 [Aspergillus thermomutatus]
MTDPTSSIFFRLPPELRLEIYRHAFSIYPNARTRVGKFKLNEHDESALSKGYEVYIHPTKAHASMYRGAPDEYRSQEDQDRLHEYRYTPQEFLAILSVSKTVYSEAMPLFYSETFFCFLNKNGPSNLVRSFLFNIGSHRVKYIRRLSCELIPLNFPCTSEDRPSLKWVAVFLSWMEHIDILEMTVFVSEERLHFGERYRNLIRGILGEGELIFDVLWGFHHLLALENIGTMRLVGDPDKMLWNRDDRLLLEGVKGRELFEGDTGHRPRVVFEHPEGLDEMGGML